MKYCKFEIYHNDSYLLEVSKTDRHKYKTCNTCNLILEKRNLIESHISKYKIKRKKYHLSGSYDGFKVVSQNFKNLYEDLNWKGLIFFDIPKNKDFYLVECMEIATINTKERPIEFKNKCSECNQYLGIYGSIPAYIDSKEIEKMKQNTFYRSDLEFGHDFEKSYSLFASEKIIKILELNKLVSDKDYREVRSIE